jgi:multiple sugar transport system permease protein
MNRQQMSHHAIKFARLAPRYLVLLFVLVVVAVPMVWIVLGSLKPQGEVLGTPIRWLPSVWQWSNYPDAWNSYGFGFFTFNSVVMTVSIVVGHLTLASLAGYGFAKFRFPGQRIAFLFVLSTMMLPVQVTMIPLFILMKRFGWVDTYQGLIVPLVVNAFGVFMMRQYMISIPDDLIDAARIDGASELGIFFRVVLPISTPALAGLGMLVGMGAWGEFLWPILISTSDKMVTLPLGLSYFKFNYWTPYNWLLAMAVVVTIPPVIAFIFAQKQLIESGALTGLK